MSRDKVVSYVLSFLMIFNPFVPLLFAQEPLTEEEIGKKVKEQIHKHKKEQKEKGHPKISYLLIQLEDEYKKGGEKTAKDFAEERGLKIKDGNKVRVKIYLEDGVSGETFDKALLEPYGGEIIYRGSGHITAHIPVNMIRKIADEVEGINYISHQIGRIKTSSIRSEGLSKVGFSNYSAAGITGLGVKIAVIDAGFKGLSNAINSGNLPSNVVKFNCATSLGCISTTFSSETDEHGTAVAEIVHDMAPKAQLYLLKVDEEITTLKNAATFSNNTGVKVINHSVNWYSETFYDGQCYSSDSYAKDSPNCTAKDAKNNGILWVNSAGNDAKSHYESTYIDRSGWECHTTDASLTMMPYIQQVNANETVTLSLTWNAWPKTGENYDLYLYDSSGSTVAESTDDQTGSQPPKEELTWKLDTSKGYTPGTYRVCINQWDASSNHKFELFSMNHELKLYDPSTNTFSPTDPSSSISSPADSSSVLAVGAIHHDEWEAGTLYDYGSQGPTNAASNNIKPDIMGPDGVSTYSYGTQGFSGTSAAAPHVAGAAALMLSQNSSYTVDQLTDSLIKSADYMSSTESNCPSVYDSATGEYHNNCYGYGRLKLPDLYILNVYKSGQGTGTVTSSPSGIDCGSDCSGSYISGISVALSATPDTGYLFEGWSGACSGQTCQITMSGNKNATATFYMPTLSVSKIGAGDGTITSSPAGISCGATCSANFNAGSLVTLSVTPETGSSFLGWSGAGCSGTGQCNVTMSDSTSVTASFGVDTATCPNGPAKIVGKSSYQTLQAAYNAAVDGDTIQTQAITITENVTADRNISININGGYNCYYTSNPMTTALKGALTINSGTVNIKDFNLQN